MNQFVFEVRLSNGLSGTESGSFYENMSELGAIPSSPGQTLNGAIVKHSGNAASLSRQLAVGGVRQSDLIISEVTKNTLMHQHAHHSARIKNWKSKGAVFKNI